MSEENHVEVSVVADVAPAAPAPAAASEAPAAPAAAAHEEAKESKEAKVSVVFTDTALEQYALLKLPAIGDIFALLGQVMNAPASSKTLTSAMNHALTSLSKDLTGVDWNSIVKPNFALRVRADVDDEEEDKKQASAASSSSSASSSSAREEKRSRSRSRSRSASPASSSSSSSDSELEEGELPAEEGDDENAKPSEHKRKSLPSPHSGHGNVRRRVHASERKSRHEVKVKPRDTAEKPAAEKPAAERPRREENRLLKGDCMVLYCLDHRQAFEIGRDKLCRCAQVSEEFTTWSNLAKRTDPRDREERNNILRRFANREGLPIDDLVFVAQEYTTYISKGRRVERRRCFPGEVRDIKRQLERTANPGKALREAHVNRLRKNRGTSSH